MNENEQNIETIRQAFREEAHTINNEFAKVLGLMRRLSKNEESQTSKEQLEMVQQKLKSISKNLKNLDTIFENR